MVSGLKLWSFGAPAHGRLKQWTWPWMVKRLSPSECFLFTGWFFWNEYVFFWRRHFFRSSLRDETCPPPKKKHKSTTFLCELRPGESFLEQENKISWRNVSTKHLVKKEALSWRQGNELAVRRLAKLQKSCKGLRGKVDDVNSPKRWFKEECETWTYVRQIRNLLSNRALDLDFHGFLVRSWYINLTTNKHRMAETT